MDRSLCIRRSTHPTLERHQARLTPKVQCAKPLPYRFRLLGFVKRRGENVKGEKTEEGKAFGLEGGRSSATQQTVAYLWITP